MQCHEFSIKPLLMLNPTVNTFQYILEFVCHLVDVWYRKCNKYYDWTPSVYVHSC